MNFIDFQNVWEPQSPYFRPILFWLKRTFFTQTIFKRQFCIARGTHSFHFNVIEKHLGSVIGIFFPALLIFVTLMGLGYILSAVFIPLQNNFWYILCILFPLTPSKWNISLFVMNLTSHLFFQFFFHKSPGKSIFSIWEHILSIRVKTFLSISPIESKRFPLPPACEVLFLLKLFLPQVLCKSSLACFEVTKFL